MAYKIGQFRRDQISSYDTGLNFTKIKVETAVEGSINTTFIDTAISMVGQNVLENGKNYYLNFTVKRRLDSPQIFAVKLKNSDSLDGVVQTAGTVTVQAGEETLYDSFEMIISPNGTFNQIVFELSRESLDYMTQNPDGTGGRLTQIEVDRYSSLRNIINDINASTGAEKLLKIGVQGVPGQLMCINGEGIRIGRTGIYEINNGFIVEFISFILTDNDNFFIMDYQY